jgi:hypothetical protein
MKLSQRYSWGEVFEETLLKSRKFDWKDCRTQNVRQEKVAATSLNQIYS